MLAHVVRDHGRSHIEGIDPGHEDVARIASDATELTRVGAARGDVHPAVLGEPVDRGSRGSIERAARERLIRR